MYSILIEAVRDDELHPQRPISISKSLTISFQHPDSVCFGLKKYPSGRQMPLHCFITLSIRGWHIISHSGTVGSHPKQDPSVDPSPNFAILVVAFKMDDKK